MRSLPSSNKVSVWLLDAIGVGSKPRVQVALERALTTSVI